MRKARKGRQKIEDEDESSSSEEDQRQITLDKFLARYETSSDESDSESSKQIL